MPKSIAIVGAGPVGLEAALQGTERGWAVTVFERGTAGAAMRAWGHVRMFSPFGLNASVLGRQCLAEAIEDEALLTGEEFAELYLQPIAQKLGDRIQTGATVRAIGRGGALKDDWIGNPERGARPFHLLIEQDGRERIEEADVVLDCSGTWGQGNGLGAGGMPVPGERECAQAIFPGVPDVAGAERAAFAGKRVLVVGGGHSAATTVNTLAELAARNAETRVEWLIRKPVESPAAEIPEDPLVARAELARSVNRLARDSSWLRLRAGETVAKLERNGEGVIVELKPGGEKLKVDVIVAATGFRPDLALARELQVSLCYATEGTLPLAAQLLGETGGDCLAVAGFGVDTLRHPEPGYFALGMKSYGRSSDFLIRTGYEQVTAVMDFLDES